MQSERQVESSSPAHTPSPQSVQSAGHVSIDSPGLHCPSPQPTAQSAAQLACVSDPPHVPSPHPPQSLGQSA